MPRLRSKYFGILEYSEDAVYRFAGGLPGFEQHLDFVFIQQPRTNPLVFMQSLVSPDVCFIAISVHIANPAYNLDLSPEDMEALAFHGPDPAPVSPPLLCFALVTILPGCDPTVNLAAPVVVNTESRRGVQSFQNAYPRAYPLASAAAREEIAC